MKLTKAYLDDKKNMIFSEEKISDLLELSFQQKIDKYDVLVKM